MKVKELIEQLQELSQEDEIVVTATDGDFRVENFEVRPAYEDDQVPEIRLDVYVDSYKNSSYNMSYPIKLN